jgi:hypothetical protein
MTRIKRTQFIIIALLLAAVNVIAQGLPTARPEDEGFSPERLAYIDQYYSEKIDHGDMAGIVTLVSRHGKIVHFSALGYADVEKHTKMEKNTIFRQYSMTARSTRQLRPNIRPPFTTSCAIRPVSRTVCRTINSISSM